MKYTVKRARNQRAKTITFSPDQLNHLRLAVETEMEDMRDVPDPQAYYNELKAIHSLLLPGIWIELYRSVSEDKGQFEETENHVFNAPAIRRFIETELTEAWEQKALKGVRKKDIPKLARRFTWDGEPEFVEFDSGNPSHACGYWELRIIGPPELEEAIEESREPG